MTKERRADENDPESELIVIYHEASLFFPLPDGSAQLYKLFGKSKEPTAQDTIVDTVQAKKPRYICVPVENWLKTMQGFTVNWDVEGEQDPTTFIRGANRFDVPGSSKKDYKLNFLAYKTGVSKFRVNFKNEQTGEYIFYNIEVTSQEADLIGTIELVSPVRESVSKVLLIENPTKDSVEVLKSQFSFDNDNVEVSPEAITIPPQSVCYSLLNNLGARI